ncbi:hypothetical protein ACFPMF_01925 [Larkinella bovis]|uniref:Uncharacterized protein n=1 Tax=Larkinella bovis TaxID=683041 RepID=A0ABW0I635_9BACT
MGFIRNITLTVGLIWAVFFRVYPAVTGTTPHPHFVPQTTVKQAIHLAGPASDAAVFLLQDEDERVAPALDRDLLPALPPDWLTLLLPAFLALPPVLVTIRKPAIHHQPYYLLYCALRIPIA